MKVKSIEIAPSIDEYNKEMILRLLKRDIPNDILLNKFFVDITIDMNDPKDHPQDFLYRLLWEHIYLRRSTYHQSSKYLGNKCVLIRISLVEAINYIRTVTPPMYKSRVHELYQGLDEIKESLEIFLIEEKNDGGFNLASFRKGMGFNPFETETTYDFSRTEIFRKTGYDGITVDLECYTGSFQDIYEEKIDYEDGIQMQCVVSTYNRSWLWKFLDEMKDEWKRISVLNVFKHDSLGTFAQLYLGYNSEDFPALTSMIQTSYKTLMK